MKSLEEKRDELSDELCLHQDFSMLAGFNMGWDACAKEYEKENAELKKQLEIAKKALQEINKLEKELQIERNRLNWLVDNNYVVTAGVNSFWVSEVDGQYRLGPKFSTAREAIDECMEFNP